MIICERCGTQNADGERFCGACGAFLEWDGTPATTPPTTPTTTPADQTRPQRSNLDRTPTDDRTTATDRTPTDDRTIATDRTPDRGRIPEPTPSELWPTPPVDTAPPTDALPPTPAVAQPDPAPVSPAPPANPAPVSPAPVSPAQTTPIAVKPGEVKPRRPGPTTTPADEPPPNAGDLICGECGAGNDPSRKFCRRCGTSLMSATVVPQPSWWRRLLNRLRGRRYEAGYRRQVRQPIRIQGRLIVLFMLAALILLAAFPGRPYIRLGTEIVKDRIRDHVSVTPVAARASSSARSAGPGRVLDGVSNQFWAPNTHGSGEGQWLEVDLPEPTRVLDLVIHSGVSSERKQFLTQARPREVQLTFTDDRGKTNTEIIKLRDEPGKQEFNIRQDRVVRLRITLRSAYGATPARRVAVAELEVFGRE